MVEAAGGEPGTVGAEGCAVDDAVVPQDGQIGQRPGIPESYRRIVRGGGDHVSVGTESDPSDAEFMAAQDTDHGATADIPEPHRAIFVPGGEAGTVGAETHVVGLTAGLNQV